MRIRVNNRILEGRGIDVLGVTPEALVRAVRECTGIPQSLPETDGSARANRESCDPENASISDRHVDRPSPDEWVISVEAPSPETGHEQLGRLPLDCSLRRALAAAARSCGKRTSLDRDIARLERSLERVDPPSVDLEAARRRLAATGDKENQLRERVASLRGELRACRRLDAETETVETELTETAAKLSEAETERIAAEQALQRERERARDAWDIRERQLELQDELANRRRSAWAISLGRCIPRSRPHCSECQEKQPPDGTPSDLTAIGSRQISRRFGSHSWPHRRYSHLMKFGFLTQPSPPSG